MKIPHPIPYQGSKRNLAQYIMRYFPGQFDRLIEPFAGSAAISIAAAYYACANRFIINDINRPLIALLNMIINRPEEIARKYENIWQTQFQDQKKHYYNYIRQKFNRNQKPEYLLFLLAKCVKAAVRYNTDGDFNQSQDNRRFGRNPSMMRKDIYAVSCLLKNKTSLYAMHYSDIFQMITTEDLVYMDPPYQGTGLNGGFNYAGIVEYTKFIDDLAYLQQKNISFILSYDGKTGQKSYGQPLPSSLRLTKIEIAAGRSSQATLLNRKEITYESIFLSKSLTDKINLDKIDNRQQELMLVHG